ncbi:MAG TPA: TonB-dependent receptor [Flavobacteriales bacterium]|nr:TonB-dependent receptor [Flavobacteriales bacterium]
MNRADRIFKTSEGNMHKGSRIIGAAAVLLSTQLSAQTITFLDEATRAPVPDVPITCVGTGRTITSMADGRADISSLKGCGRLLVDHLAYKPITFDWAALADTPVVNLSYRLNQLREVVTSGSRFNEARADVPEKIDVLSRREIGFMAQPTAAELLQNTGTVFVQKSQLGGGSPTIRGFQANRVLLVVDGVRMNNAITRSGHTQDLITVDQYALDRVEVLSGPNSVAYGSDALGGTIHLITRSPKFLGRDSIRTAGDAFLRFSTAAMEKTAHAGIELRGRDLTSFTSITASDFGDLRQGSTRNPFYEDLGRMPFHVVRENGQDVVRTNDDSNVQLGTGYKQIDVLEKLRLRSGDHLIHQLNLQLSTSSNVPRYDRLSAYATDSTGGIIPTYAEWFYGPQQRVLAAYTAEVDKEATWFNSARITPSWQHQEQSRYNRRFQSNKRGINIEKVDVFGCNVDLEKRIGKHEIRYGLNLSHETVNSTAWNENISTGEHSYRTTRYPNGGSTMDNLAAYVNHSMEISPKLIISEGLRFTRVGLTSTFADNDDFGFLNGSYEQRNGALTWRAGAVYMPGKGWRFSLLASSGFRAPNVDDIGKVFDSAQGDVIVPNPDLRPEYTTNFEGSISRTINDRSSIEVNGFYTLYTNAITVGPYTVHGADSIDYDGVLSRVAALQNTTEAYLYGASAQFIGHFNDHFTLRSGFTYTYARIRTDSTDQPLDHIPPVFGQAGLEYQAKRLRLSGYVVFNGWKRLKDYNTTAGSEDNLKASTPQGSPAWYTLNVRGSFAFNAHLGLQLALENITDMNYRTIGSGVSAPGRNFMASVQVRF